MCYQITLLITPKRSLCTEITSAVYSQPTKAVYGVEVAPYDDNYIVSFGDNQIAVWDSRSLEKSILLLTQSKIVSKVSWCPTR